jgi:CPA1 family monovalent cation:H+ antiporter
MDTELLSFLALLGVAILVAIFARRLALPYTVGLVVVGALLAVSRAAPAIVLTHDLVFDILLPPLLFEASLALPWRRLYAYAWPIVVLSTLGTILAAAITAAGMVWLLDWPLPAALLFGVLIAATDPVAVIALFRDQGVHGRLRLLVDSESLFNDGVAAVLFAFAVEFVSRGRLDGTALVSLVVIVAGGIGIGLAVGGVAIVVAGRTTDRLEETALTVLAAWGSFALAEHFHASGVLACVAAGLLMGNLGVLRPSVPGSPFSDLARFAVDFWGFAAFLANSIIFLLIGAALASTPFSRFGWLALAVTIGIVLVARAATVYPLCSVFQRSRWAVPWREQHVLWWGGLRGALALALALALPPGLPWRDEIVTAAFGVVAFSVVVQGLTMPAFLRLVGIHRVPSDDRTGRAGRH